MRILFSILFASLVTSSAWAQVVEQKLTMSDPDGYDQFGKSVSLANGQQAIVGAWTHSHGVFESGSAYVFERQADGSWVEAAELRASDGAEEDVFGFSVSMQQDRVLVGARDDDDNGERSGSAYVFERQRDGSWLEVAKLIASDGAAGDNFGYSASLSVDRALVGAWTDDEPSQSGSAYVFERQRDGSWLEVAKLIASDGAENDLFGESVSLSGEYAIVGAPLDDDDGLSSGSAYMFERQEDGSWLEVAKLTASDGAFGDFFGDAVSLSGARALVGAKYDDLFPDDGRGSAYIFERQADDTWLEVAKLPSPDPDGPQFENFGARVSLSEDLALIFAFDGLGLAFVFERQTDGSWLQIHRITASDGQVADNFGRGLALHGNLALIGAPGDDDAGSAYLYENLIPTAVDMTTDLPEGYLLSAPHPNPFNMSTKIRFSLPESAQVRLVVYDVLGRQISVLVDGTKEAGMHEVVFDASDLPSGMYLYRLETPQGSFARTMLLAK